MTVTVESKRQLLIAFTGFVVAFVRSKVQFHHSLFSTAGHFFGMWFAHYLVVFFALAIAYAAISTNEVRFLGDSYEKRPRISVEEVMVCGSFILIIVAVAVLMFSGVGSEFIREEY